MILYCLNISSLFHLDLVQANEQQMLYYEQSNRIEMVNIELFFTNLQNTKSIPTEINMAHVLVDK